MDTPNLNDARTQNVLVRGLFTMLPKNEQNQVLGLVEELKSMCSRSMPGHMQLAMSLVATQLMINENK